MQGGGINFDAKIRRNSTDAADLFHAHIGGMDTFARALIIADNILKKSDYKKFRTERYASFDSGTGKDFEEGKLTLEELRELCGCKWRTCSNKWQTGIFGEYHKQVYLIVWQ